MSKEQFDEFDVVANKIMSDAIDELTEKIKDLKLPDDDIMKVQMLSTAACMKLSKDLLKRYHEELMKHLRSKGL